MIFLILAKGCSSRIAEKNLQDVGGEPLLEWTLQRYARWFPDATFHVVTESRKLLEVASGFTNVEWYPPPIDDPLLKKSASVVCAEALGFFNQYPFVVLQPTSPFTLKSEFFGALQSDKPYVRSGRFDTHHTKETSLAFSQNITPIGRISGNFIICKQPLGIADGNHPLEFVTKFDLHPVSLLSSLDIDTQEDLDHARWVARYIKESDFDDC